MFYAVIFMRILCLLNYHVKIRPYNIIISTRLFTLNTFINYYIKIANIDKIPANDVLTGL